MPDDSSLPIGFFPNSKTKADRYVNPFYGIPYQYLPLNLDHMLWWADHFVIRFGFYRAALFRIANYFITALNIECEDEQAKKQYQNILEELYWKEALAMAGLNLLAYGNVFLTVNQGFTRFLVCPKCSKTSSIERLDDYEFSNKGQFMMTCKNPKCAFKGAHKCIDKPAKDTDKINIVFWNPREIKVRHEETTGDIEYYWDYPQAYAAKVVKANDKFYSKKTPKVIFDAIFDKKLIAFNPKNFLHLKLATPAGIKTDGRAVPPSIFMFDDFFMLQVLRRFNEVIAFEDINPFRVISMGSETNSQANPILNQNAQNWTNAVSRMIDEHRLDPGAYHMFPLPINYQQLGGQGKTLAPVELMQASVQNILNALNIPQELYTMNLQTQTVGPSLRLFENSWSVVVDNYNKLLNHWGDVIGKIKGLPKAKISLIPVTLSDDIERKSVIAQLVSANAIAKSEMLNLYGFDFKEQLRKKMQEDRDAKDIQEEEQVKQELEAQKQQGATGAQPGQAGMQGAGSTPQDVLQQAQEMAQQLFPLDAAGRRSQLQQIKASNLTLYSATKAALEELTAQAKSSGVQQSKQQAQQ